MKKTMLSMGVLAFLAMCQPSMAGGHVATAQPSTLKQGEPMATADCSLGIPLQEFDGELDKNAPTVYKDGKVMPYKTMVVTGSDQFGRITKTLAGDAVNIPVTCVWEKSHTWAATE